MCVVFVSVITKVPHVDLCGMLISLMVVCFAMGGEPITSHGPLIITKSSPADNPPRIDRRSSSIYFPQVTCELKQ